MSSFMVMPIMDDELSVVFSKDIQIQITTDNLLRQHNDLIVVDNEIMNEMKKRVEKINSSIF